MISIGFEEVIRMRDGGPPEVLKRTLFSGDPLKDAVQLVFDYALAVSRVYDGRRAIRVVAVSELNYDVLPLTDVQLRSIGILTDTVLRQLILDMEKAR